MFQCSLWHRNQNCIVDCIVRAAYYRYCVRSKQHIGSYFAHIQVSVYPKEQLVGRLPDNWRLAAADSILTFAASSSITVLLLVGLSDEFSAHTSGLVASICVTLTSICWVSAAMFVTSPLWLYSMCWVAPVGWSFCVSTAHAGLRGDLLISLPPPILCFEGQLGSRCSRR